MPKKIIGLLSLALVLRLIISVFQYSGDLKNHLAWGAGFLTQPLGFYSQHFSGFNDPNYPPITIFLFAIARLLFVGTGNVLNFLNTNIRLFPSLLVPLFQTENMQMAFLKISGIIADIGIGVLIYKILVKRSAKHPLLITSLYLFNPAVIYISSVWGQIEPLTIFLILLSFYHALYFKKNKYFSLIYFSLAILTKQTALWFAPLYLFLWYKELKAKDLVIGTISSAAIFFLSYLPFGLNPPEAVKNYFSTLSGSSTVVSDSAWNLWFFIFPAGTPDSTLLGIFSIRQISIVLILLALAIIYFKLIKKYSSDRFLQFLFIWSLVVFFLQTRVHERHLAPAIVFLLLVPNLSFKVFIDYFLLSVYHLSNLHWSLKLPFIR